MDSEAPKRTLRSSNRLSLTLSGRKPSGRRKRESTEDVKAAQKCEPPEAEVCDDKRQIPPEPVRGEQADATETIIILSDDENDSQTPSKSSIREYFTPSKHQGRLSPTAGRSSVCTTGGKHTAAANSTARKAPQTLPRKAAGKVRRKICPSTNIKMLTKKYFDDSQKRITNFFNKQNVDPERLGYCQVLKESVMPTIVTGDMEVETMLQVSIKEGSTPLRISQIVSLSDIPELSAAESCPAKIMERMERMQSAAYDPEQEDWNMERVNVPIATTSSVSVDESTCDSGVSFLVPDTPDIQTSASKRRALRKETPRSASCKTPPARPRQSKAPKSTAKKEGRKIVCPKYKIIAGTNFAVDGFRYGDIEGVTHYFLTHFHADHYIGLKKSFAKPLIMSPITARLVKTFINVPEEHYRLIELHQPIVIDHVEIIALDANHCPGGIMFLFRLPNGTNILHTGDFRASAEMEEYPEFWNYPIDCIYLDTTYLSSKYAFKSQWESVSDARNTVVAFLNKHIGAKVLIVCGSYLIGKEKVWMELAVATGMKVWTEPNRWKALSAIADPDQLSLLVADPAAANIHVLAMNKLSYDELSDYMSQFPDRYDTVIALRPSGWEKNSKPQWRGRINIVGIEYSEHSSFDELKRFVQFIRPREVISTVPYGNSNPNRTPMVPASWYQGEIRPQRKALQLSITNFMSTLGPNSGNECNKPTVQAARDQSSTVEEIKQEKGSIIKEEPSIAQDVIDLDDDENDQRSEQGECDGDSDWLP
ncbi:DNA cross-link repair 1A protein-like [Anopheles aquasalis]|uniref:DNA cross-link repair 1A protein-like n=1 Tax=Anopheles aquasalis TaxID=42839 RepID=UPI00215A43AC|nr:DNA cross-link repair 1A protein-like [Anopheles aquasalis]